MTTSDGCFEKEVTRRIQLGWVPFGKLRDIFSSKIPQCLKTKVFEQCVLRVMPYGSETWSLTMGLIRRLRITQRAMERAMLGVSLRDQIRNEEIRRRTRVTDIAQRVAKLKWKWAGHIARRTDGRWGSKLLEWQPRTEKTSTLRGAFECPSKRLSGLQNEEPPHNTRCFKDYCLLYPTLDPTT
ncbi:jg16849 [Pararge aegeria aegeria]|uniref:Jg16849 protein n=1 Tax=Pararge aegeria aegeria TaxID=348720 RepID=A0A8S4RQ32_9NEOP|nr:jg16849 [Pararge aegeria aegeria]